MKEFTQPTVIIVSGPTAVGKTAIAIELAKKYGTDIISADSRQCYKEMSIGVAKPSLEELAQVNHFFISSHSIVEEVNAGSFEKFALHATQEIFQKNNVAIMVGGTGLYIKSFCEGIDPMPNVPNEIRNQIIENYKDKGLIWLQKELQQKDPGFWEIAEKQNPQRLMRALEILHATGLSILHFRQDKKIIRPFNIIKIGFELPKEKLHEHIHSRVDQMMKAGLLEEVNSLQSFRSQNALQTVGYREIFDYFDGKISLDQAIINIKTNTRHYAKRQMTWFRKDTGFTWVNPSLSSVFSIPDMI